MKNIKKLLLLSFLSVSIFACDDARESNQDAEPIGSLNSKAMVSITADVASGDVTEGDVITFGINMDKPVSVNVGYVAVLKGGTANDADVTLGSATISKFSTTASISVTINADSFPELDETAIITIEADGPTSGYSVHPDSNIPNFTYNILSPVSPTDLMVGLEWDNVSAPDIDMVSFYGTVEAGVTATGDMPEVGNLILGSNPDGTYFLGIDPYEVEADVTSFDYKWTFGQPDGSVSVIEGTFDYENRDTVYTTGTSAALGGSTIYLVVQVEKTATTYVATSL